MEKNTSNNRTLTLVGPIVAALLLLCGLIFYAYTQGYRIVRVNNVKTGSCAKTTRADDLQSLTEQERALIQAISDNDIDKFRSVLDNVSDITPPLKALFEKDEQAYIQVLEEKGEQDINFAFVRDLPGKQLKLETFFENHPSYALCEAVSDNDMEKFKELLKTTSDVNSPGKGNMTPLLWALYEENEEAFKLLLEKGADPNIQLKSSFTYARDKDRIPSVYFSGDSITSIAASRYAPKFLKLVLEHQGDPNLVSPYTKLSPLFDVIFFSKSVETDDALENFQMLVDAGANVDYDLSNQADLLFYSIQRRFPRFVLALLKNGADYYALNNNGLDFMIQISKYSPNIFRSTELREWLTNNGFDIEAAKKAAENLEYPIELAIEERPWLPQKISTSSEP